MSNIVSEISKLKHLHNNFYIIYDKQNHITGLSNKPNKKYICKSCLDVSENDLNIIYIDILKIKII